MDIGVVSMRYAKALFKYADDLNQVDSIYDSMITLKSSYMKLPELKSALSDPVSSDEQKKRLLITASNITDNSCLVKFFDLILTKNRVDMMIFVVQAYINLYRTKKNIVTCELTVPKVLSASTIERIKSIVECKTKKNVELIQNFDPSIIGGFILEYDSLCLDASVTGSLRNIRKKLVNNL